MLRLQLNKVGRACVRENTWGAQRQRVWLSFQSSNTDWSNFDFVINASGISGVSARSLCIASGVSSALWHTFFTRSRLLVFFTSDALRRVNPAMSALALARLFHGLQLVIFKHTRSRRKRVSCLSESRTFHNLPTSSVRIYPHPSFSRLLRGPHLSDNRDLQTISCSGKGSSCSITLASPQARDRGCHNPIAATPPHW